MNQATFAWSFRHISTYPREKLSTLKIMRSEPKLQKELNLYPVQSNFSDFDQYWTFLSGTNTDWPATSNIKFYRLPTNIWNDPHLLVWIQVLWTYSCLYEKSVKHRIHFFHFFGFFGKKFCFKKILMLINNNYSKYCNQD